MRPDNPAISGWVPTLPPHVATACPPRGLCVPPRGHPFAPASLLAIRHARNHKILPSLRQPLVRTHHNMPPKATTSSTTNPRRPMAPGVKPAAAAGSSSTGRPVAARPRPGTGGGAAGPSRPRPPARSNAAGPSGSSANVKPDVDVKPKVNVGEEEWSKLMKETYGQKQSAEWYAKGAKSVEVGLTGFLILLYGTPYRSEG